LGCLVLLLKAIGMVMSLWQRSPILAIAVGVGLAATLLILGYLLRPQRCDICGNKLQRASYIWELEGAKKRICPHCNRSLERKQSQRAEKSAGVVYPCAPRASGDTDMCGGELWPGRGLPQKAPAQPTADRTGTIRRPGARSRRLPRQPSGTRWRALAEHSRRRMSWLYALGRRPTETVVRAKKPDAARHLRHLGLQEL
jgi:hypothetical protein